MARAQNRAIPSPSASSRLVGGGHNQPGGRRRWRLVPYSPNPTTPGHGLGVGRGELGHGHLLWSGGCRLLPRSRPPARPRRSAGSPVPCRRAESPGSRCQRRWYCWYAAGRPRRCFSRAPSAFGAANPLSAVATIGKRPPHRSGLKLSSTHAPAGGLLRVTRAPDRAGRRGGAVSSLSPRQLARPPRRPPACAAPPATPPRSRRPADKCIAGPRWHGARRFGRRRSMPRRSPACGMVQPKTIPFTSDAAARPYSRVDGDVYGQVDAWGSRARTERPLASGKLDDQPIRTGMHGVHGNNNQPLQSAQRAATGSCQWSGQLTWVQDWTSARICSRARSSALDARATRLRSVATAEASTIDGNRPCVRTPLIGAILPYSQGRTNCGSRRDVLWRRARTVPPSGTLETRIHAKLSSLPEP